MGSSQKAPPTKGARATGAAAPRRAWRSPGAVCLFFAIAALALAADLVSKQRAFGSLLNDPALGRIIRQRRSEYAEWVGNDTRRMLQLVGRRGRLMPGVHVSLSTNPGVVFGLPMPRWAVACATVVTIVLVGYFFGTADRRARAMHLAMALILAGALGNLYDRMFSEVALPGGHFEPIRHEVRDFIDVSELMTVRWLSDKSLYPWVFNVADIWLVVGVSVLLVYWVLSQRRLKMQKAQEAPKAKKGGRKA